MQALDKGPANHLAAVEIEHDGEEEPAFGGSDIGHADAPCLVRPGRRRGALGQPVGGDGSVVPAVCGLRHKAPAGPCAQPGGGPALIAAVSRAVRDGGLLERRVIVPECRRSLFFPVGFSFGVFVSFIQLDPSCIPNAVRETETGSEIIGYDVYASEPAPCHARQAAPGGRSQISERSKFHLPRLARKVSRHFGRKMAACEIFHKFPCEWRWAFAFSFSSCASWHLPPLFHFSYSRLARVVRVLRIKM